MVQGKKTGGRKKGTPNAVTMKLGFEGGLDDIGYSIFNPLLQENN